MTESSMPVTVVVRRRVKEGRAAEYEVWLDQLVSQASRFPGYLGTHIQRPSAAGPSEYTSVFRFDSLEHLERFERSEVRREALEAVAELVEADAVWERLSGLEVWFEAPPGTLVPQPSRLRMAILLTLVVYGLVLSIGKLVGAVLVDVPVSLRLFVVIVIEVFLMTYVLMPWLTRRLARFIYPSNRVSGEST